MAGFLKDFFKPKRPTDTAISPESEAGAATKAEPVQPDPDAVANATSLEELEHLAIQGKTAGQRREAVGRIDDPESLARVAGALKGRDKGAYQAAKQKLRDHQQAAEHARQQEAAIEKLLEDVATLAETQDTKQYQARLDALERRWSSLQNDANDSQASRFDHLIHQCRNRATTLAAAEAESVEKQKRQDEQSATVETLEATIQQIRGDATSDDVSVSALDAICKTQQTRWDQATNELTPEPALTERFHSALDQLQDYQRALSAYQRQESALASALEASENEQLSALITDINWPAAFPAPTTLVSAQQRVADHSQARASEQKTQQSSQRSDETESELKETLTQLEQSLEQHQLKPSRQHFRQAQKLQDQLPDRQGRHYQARITRLGRQLQELRDWLGFAARPKLEALCEQMEYLADQPMEPESKAEHIRDLQHQWHDLGGTPDQQLWQRFKQATDRAFEPCHQYFSEKNRLKSANLAKREHIVQQLQEFVDNLRWDQCDCKAVDRIERTARREWRDAKPVDFRDNRPLQKQFDRLIKTLNAGLDEERERNEALKRAIVERAEALIEHEPLKEATEAAKALQKEWEGIGITHHAEDRALWKSFRAACDQIFARLGKAREAEQQSREAAAQQAEELIGQLESLAAESTTDNELERIRNAFRDLELPRDRINALRDRFHKALSDLQSRRQALAQEHRYEHWLDALNAHQQGDPVPEAGFGAAAQSAEALTQETEVSDQARALCIRVEIATSAATPPQDQAQRMALQVNRLNEGINRDQGTDSEGHEINTLLATWCQLTPIEAIDATYYDRVREALKHWFHQSLSA